MMSLNKSSRLVLLALLTLACLTGAASLGVLTPPPVYAQQACANGGCEGTYCRYMVTFGCSFTDRNTCITTKCAFVIE